MTKKNQLNKTTKRYSNAASSPVLTEICRRLNEGIELEDDHRRMALTQPKRLRRAMAYYGCKFALITGHGEVRFRPSTGVAGGIPRALTDALRNHQIEVTGEAITPKTKRRPKRAANDDSVPFWKSPQSFYSSDEWKRLRYDTLKKYGAACQCCGASKASGAVINVDHVKPISKFPELMREPSNLQVLCSDCNWGKGNRDVTDWRA